jgi:hypothetical protein
MSKKIYKSAQGKVVDLSALMVQNEKVRAVGNMKVNARGDKIDSQGRIISTRVQQANKNYQKQTNTSAGPIPSSSRAQVEADAAAVKLAEQQQLEKARIARQAKRESVNNGETIAETVVEPTGLAAAMARAEQVKDED